MKIAVFCATSIVGRHVCGALLQAGHQIVAVSRQSVESIHLQSLMTNNAVSLVQCDVLKAGTDQLTHLLAEQKVEGVFLILPNTVRHLDHLCVEKAPSNVSSLAFGQVVVSACQTLSDQIKVFMMCTNRSPLITLGIECRHYDEVAQVETLLRRSHLISRACFVMLPVLFETFYHIAKPQIKANGKWQINLPNSSVPIDWMSAEDIGPIVATLLSHPNNYFGKTIALSAGKLLCKVICQEFNHVLAPFNFYSAEISFEEIRQSSIPNAVDWGNMFEFLCRVDQQFNVAMTLKLHPGTQTLQHWLKSHRSVLIELFKNQ